MNKASEVVLDLVTEPLSPSEINARREAETPRSGLVGTLDGSWIDPTTTSTRTPAKIMKADVHTID